MFPSPARSSASSRWRTEKSSNVKLLSFPHVWRTQASFGPAMIDRRFTCLFFFRREISGSCFLASAWFRMHQFPYDHCTPTHCQKRERERDGLSPRTMVYVDPIMIHDCWISRDLTLCILRKSAYLMQSRTDVVSPSETGLQECKYD